MRAEVYACGPPPMLEAVRALCSELDVLAQLALEAGMACGYGACFGCVVPLRNGAVRDVRNGEVTVGAPDAGVLVQTCISTAAGSCEIDV